MAQSFDPVLIEIVRKAMPNLIAHELRNVQPIGDILEEFMRVDGTKWVRSIKTRVEYEKK